MTQQRTKLSRESILTAVRSSDQRAAVIPTGYDKQAIYYRPGNMLITFKEELEAAAGTCRIVETEKEMYDAIAAFLSERNFKRVYSVDDAITAGLRKVADKDFVLSTDLIQAEVAISTCEFLIARTGSLLMSSIAKIGRQLYSYVPVHIVICSENQLVEYPEDALLKLKAKYANSLPSAVSFVTGPSRTADIEKTLVLGAHGPKELSIFVLRNKEQ